MKKSVQLFVILVFIMEMILGICPKTYAKAVPTLDDIVGVFNVCKLIKKDNQVPELNVVASNQGNGIRIRVSLRVSDDPNIPLQITNLDYSYNADTKVLTGNYVGGDNNIKEYWIKYTDILVDCIEQFHGYAEGEFMDTLNTTEIANYTLEGQGLRIEKNAPNSYYTQIDITKTMPTLDVNTYIKEDDLKDLKNNISGDGVAKYKKGKIVLYKYTVNDKDILVIGEKGDFTYKIDKSILTVLKVMFEKIEPVDYFKANYPSVDSDKNFAGYTVEVNPIKSDVEQHVFSDEQSSQDYKFVRITVDRNAVAEALNSKNSVKIPEATTPVEPTPSNPGTETGSGSGSSNSGDSGKLPNTGKEINWTVMSLYGVFSLAILGVIIGTLSKKKA